MNDKQRENFGPKLKEVRQALRMTLKQFYGPIADHVNNFSPIERKIRIIGRRLLTEVINYHHISIKWLETDEGDMFVPQVEIAAVTEPGEKKEGVPYYNINPSDTSSSEFNLLKEKAEYLVNFRPFNDCDAYLPIYGDSMYPKYASGEIIAVREVINQEIIQWGEAYLVVTNESANNITTVKLLFEHNHESKIVLRASNPNYKGDTIVSRSAIKKLFIIKGKIMRNQL